MRRQTHFGLGADQITGINYDYDGPQGCQRKIVYTTVGTFLYYQIGNAWVPQGVQSAPFDDSNVRMLGEIPL